MSNALSTYWSRYRALPTIPREAVTLGLMSLFSLTLLPLAIFIAGQIFLGDYIRDPSGSPTGSFGAFWIDFLKGVGTASPGYWIVFLGPWVLLMAVRGVMALVGAERAGS